MPVAGRVACPGLLTVFFSDEPVHDYAGAQACDLDAYAAWCRALLARGVYPPPSQFEAWFPSLAHTPRARRAHARGGRGGVRRRRVSALAAWPSALRAEGGLLADALRAGADAPPAARRRGLAAGRGRVALVVEAVREGYLLHYGAPRLLGTGDADLALLAGDRLYALGLASASPTLGDLDAVAELADVIALVAREPRRARGARSCADAAWEAERPLRRRRARSRATSRAAAARAAR